MGLAVRNSQLCRF